MLTRFGRYLLSGPREAAWPVLLLALTPLTSWVSGAAISLVALRQGAKPGLWVCLWASMPILILGAVYGHYQWWLLSIAGGTFYIWFMSVLLRSTGSWGFLIEISVLIGLVTVAAAHLFFWAFMDLSVTEWFTQTYVNYLNSLGQDQEVVKAALAQSGGTWEEFVAGEANNGTIAQLAQFTTGTVTSFKLFAGLILVSLGRYWQALMFNPGGLGKELRQIRLSKLMIIGFIVAIVFAVMGYELAIDFIPLFFVGFLVAGLSLIHSMLANIGYRVILLSAVYILMVGASKIVMPLLVSIAFLDSLFNFRKFKGA